MKFSKYIKFFATALLGTASCIAGTVYSIDSQIDTSEQNKQNWVATWVASPTETGHSISELQPGPEVTPLAFNNQTIRMIVHSSIKGETVRVRLSNAYPSRVNTLPPDCLCPSNNQFLTIAEAHIALRDENAAILPHKDRILTFNGSTSVIIPPNAEVISDPIALKVPYETDLAISLYVTPTAPSTSCDIYASRHPVSLQTSYIASATGNFTSNVDGTPFTQTTTQCFIVSGVDVLSKRAAVVAFGASITAGFSADGSTFDTNSRYTDFLTSRLIDSHNPLGVVNAGIYGNQIYYDSALATMFGFNGPLLPSGPNGLFRFNRDVLDVPGVKYIILNPTTNDLVLSVEPFNPYDATFDQYVFALTQMTKRAHERGIKIFGATITPIGGSSSDLPGVETVRQQLNAWIRTTDNFDGVIDFDEAVANPSNPTVLLSIYDGGDHLHPNASGYEAMANAVDLGLFD